MKKWQKFYTETLNREIVNINTKTENIFSQLNTKFKTLLLIKVLEDIKEFNNDQTISSFNTLLELLRQKYNEVKNLPFGNYSKKEKEVYPLPNQSQFLTVSNAANRIGAEMSGVNDDGYLNQIPVELIAPIAVTNAVNNIANSAAFNNSYFYASDGIAQAAGVFSINDLENHYNQNGNQYGNGFDDIVYRQKYQEYKQLASDLLQLQNNTLKSQYISNYDKIKKGWHEDELRILHDRLEEMNWSDNEDVLRRVNGNEFMLFIPGVLRGEIRGRDLNQIFNRILEREDREDIVEILENMLK